MVDAHGVQVAVHAADAVTSGLLRSWVESTLGLTVHPQRTHVGAGRREVSSVPSVALYDVDHRTCDVVESAAALSAHHDAVVMIGNHIPPALVRRAVGAGVKGITTKDVTVDELSAIIRRVAEGGSHVCPRLASAALSSIDSPLTSRERQCLLLSHQGSSVAQIAEQLHLAPGTVRNLLSAAVQKVGSPGRAAAAADARDRGWI